MVADHFVDDEAEELLAEFGVEIGFDRERAQPLDLAPSRAGIGGGQAGLALCSPTAWVMRKRSASMWISAASMLSMLLR